MGWYLRKSFSSGPVRFNLSKSGLGLSFGVKGARIGLGPKGAYTHLGRGGIYYRQNLSGGSSKKTTFSTGVNNAEIKQSSSRRVSDAFFDDKQIVDKQLDLDLSLKTSNKKYLMLFVSAVSSFILPGYLSSNNSLVSTVLVIIGLGALLLIPCEWIYRLILKWRTSSLYKLLAKQIGENDRIDVNKLQTIVQKETLPSVHKNFAYYKFYQNYLNMILADREITVEEERELVKIEQMLSLNETDLKKIRLWIFNKTYLAIIEDQVLTEQEDANILRAKEVLELTDDDIQDEIKTLATLRIVRQIQKDELTPAKVSIQLGDSEVCYHQTKGRLLKEKIVRTYQVAGERNKDKDFVIEKEGDLYLTSERIIVVGEGVYSIKLIKILGVETDIDRNLVSLNVDGRKTSLQITIPDSCVFSAKLNKLQESRKI